MRKNYLFLLLLSMTSIQAQVSTETMDSYFLQQQRDIMYYLPEDYTPERQYPLILVLDAEYLFDLVVAHSRFYSAQHLMPKAIVVGVRQGSFDLRWYDCDFDQASGLPTERSVAFYDFISQELLPEFGKRYNLAPFKMFVGYDISANFGNYFLFEDRSIFSSYVCISPLLAPEMESRVPSRLSALDQPLYYHLILEKDRAKDRNRSLQLTAGIRSVTKENLHFQMDEFQVPDHTSIAAYGIPQALDAVFRDYRPISREEFEKHIRTADGPVYEFLVERYRGLEELLGFRKVYDLSDVMQVYLGSKEKKDKTSLEFLLNEVKTAFPGTMMADFIQGEIYELEGDYRKALKAFGRAYMLDEIATFTRELTVGKITALKGDMD